MEGVELFTSIPRLVKDINLLIESDDKNMQLYEQFLRRTQKTLQLINDLLLLDTTIRDVEYVIGLTRILSHLEESKRRLITLCKPSVMSTNRPQPGAGRPRNASVFTPEKLVILEAFWKGGLQSYGTIGNKKKIKEVAKLTGLQANRIKHWICNRNMKETRKKLGRGWKTPSLKPRKKSAYTCFMSKYLAEHSTESSFDNGNLLMEANKKWNELKGSGRPATMKPYIDMAREANSKAPSIDDLTSSQKCQLKKKILREVQSLCDTAGSLECEAFFVIVDTDGSIQETGTLGGRTFFQEQQEVLRKFCVSALGVQQNKAFISREELRRQVQELFNEKYCEATGKPRMSYRKMSLKKFVMKGLPSGLICKKPSAYGMDDLKAILENRDRISVDLVKDSNGFPEGSVLKEGEASEIDDMENANETSDASINNSSEESSGIDVESTDETQEASMRNQSEKAKRQELQRNKIALFKEELRRKVQELFNEKYREATGKSRMSYREMSLKKFVMKGLPSGLVCKRPSAYGMADMKAILQNRDVISIAVVTHKAEAFTDSRNSQSEEASGIVHRLLVSSLKDDTENADETCEPSTDDGSNETEGIGVVGNTDEDPEAPMINDSAEDASTKDVSQILHSIYADLSGSRIGQTASMCGGKVPLVTHLTESSGDYYPIEDIVKSCTKGGKTLYRVKWKGYPSEFDEWVEECDITKEAVDKFKRRSSLRQRKVSKKH